MVRDFSQFLPPSKSPATPQDRPLLDRLGWQPFFAQQIGADDLAARPPVRVIEIHRSGLHVLGDGIDTSLPPNADVTVGDWLLYDAELPASSELLDRKSLVKRRAPGSDRQIQLIAANIDTSFIVTSCNQDFNVARLERYIALAFEAEITPVIVLTKTDLVDDVAEYVTPASAISDRVEVVSLDARQPDAIATLAPWCKPGQTVAFMGSSGVGKSTLANTLSHGDEIETQGVREDDAKGRHTTTRRQLHLVPGGCVVMDTPGMRELQMTDVTAGIESVFEDLHALSTQCKFKDCQHETEPGCAVRKALEDATIDATRLQRWQKLRREDAFNAASLAERRRKDRQFGKRIRQIVKGNRK